MSEPHQIIPWTHLQVELAPRKSGFIRGNVVALAHFKYHGITIKYYHLAYRNGEFILSGPPLGSPCIHFHDPTEREQFYTDVLKLYYDALKAKEK